MRYSSLAAMAAALCLAGSARSQERPSQSLGLMIVVRHDPGLIRLDDSMIEALLDAVGERALATLENVPEGPTPAAIAWIDSVVPDQPPGVFVGELAVESPVLAPPRLRAFAAAVVRELEAALRQRLDEKPRRRLHEQLAELEEQITDVSRRRVAAVRAAQVDAVIADLGATLDAARLELESERTVVESLAHRLADESQRSERAQAVAQQRAIDLAKIRTELEVLVKRGVDLTEVAGRSQELGARQNAHAVAADEARSLAERVAQLATALDESQAGIARAQARVDSVTERLGQLRAERTELETTDAPDSTERELEALRTRRHRLTERLAEFHPVEVEVWH